MLDLYFVQASNFTFVLSSRGLGSGLDLGDRLRLVVIEPLHGKLMSKHVFTQPANLTVG